MLHTIADRYLLKKLSLGGGCDNGAEVVDAVRLRRHWYRFERSRRNMRGLQVRRALMARSEVSGLYKVGTGRAVDIGLEADNASVEGLAGISEIPVFDFTSGIHYPRALQLSH